MIACKNCLDAEDIVAECHIDDVSASYRARGPGSGVQVVQGRDLPGPASGHCAGDTESQPNLTHAAAQAAEYTAAAGLRLHGQVRSPPGPKGIKGQERAHMDSGPDSGITPLCAGHQHQPC